MGLVIDPIANSPNEHNEKSFGRLLRELKKN